MALKICVLEWPGSYGDQVGKELFPDSIATYIDSNAAIVKAIIEREVEWCIGIVPVSNLYGGEVNESWKSLEKGRGKLVVAGSFSIKPDHAVVRRKEHAGKEVTRIISHQQAYDQSKYKLLRLYPEHEFIPSKSTIGALKMIENKTDVVICSAKGIRTNEHLGKDHVIEHENISPDDNETKFLVIATRESVTQAIHLPPSDIDTLMVSLTNKPRQLANKTVLLSYILGVNIHEWGNTKVEPGVKPTYYAQFITDRISRNRLTKTLMKYFGISPIPLKEDLVLW